MGSLAAAQSPGSEAVTAVNLVVIRSIQPAASVEFFKILGLKFAEEQHGSGPVHFAAEVGDVVFEVYPAKDREAVADVRLGFRVADLSATLAALRAAGAAIVAEPKLTTWGLRAVVADPDGRKIELTERAFE